MLSGGPVVESTVLACAAACVLLLYGHRDYAVALLRAAVGRPQQESRTDDRNRLFSAFIDRCLILGAVALAVLCVRVIDRAGAQPVWGAHALPGWAVMAAVVAAAVVVAFVQAIMLKVSGSVALNGEFTDRLRMLRRQVFALTSIAVVPPALLSVYSPEWAAAAFGSVAAVALAAGAGLLIVKSYMLFRLQRVSILIWILYLCAVEIFPVSFVVLSVLRNT